MHGLLLMHSRCSFSMQCMYSTALHGTAGLRGCYTARRAPLVARDVSEPWLQATHMPCMAPVEGGPSCRALACCISTTVTPSSLHWHGMLPMLVLAGNQQTVYVTQDVDNMLSQPQPGSMRLARRLKSIV